MKACEGFFGTKRCQQPATYLLSVEREEHPVCRGHAWQLVKALLGRGGSVRVSTLGLSSGVEETAGRVRSRADVRRRNAARFPV